MPIRLTPVSEMIGAKRRRTSGASPSTCLIYRILVHPLVPQPLDTAHPHVRVLPSRRAINLPRQRRHRWGFLIVILFLNLKILRMP